MSASLARTEWKVGGSTAKTGLHADHFEWKSNIEGVVGRAGCGDVRRLGDREITFLRGGAFRVPSEIGIPRAAESADSGDAPGSDDPQEAIFKNLPCLLSPLAGWSNSFWREWGFPRPLQRFSNSFRWVKPQWGPTL